MSGAQQLPNAMRRAIERPRDRTAALALDHGLPLLAYAGLAIALTWPLAAHLSDAFPSTPGEGAQDLWEKLWNIWWAGEALRRGANPFFTDALFYPRGASLLFHPLNLTSSLMALPLGALFGPTAAYNLVVLLSFVLSGYAVFLLARAHGCRRAAALVGGLAYTAATFHVFHTRLSHLELVPMQWLPLYALALDGLLMPDERRRTKDGRSPFVLRPSSLARVLLATLALLALIFTSLYVALYAALLTALWIVWWAIGKLRPQLPAAAPAPSEPRAGLLRLAALGLLTLAVVGPALLLPMAREMRESSYMLASPDVSASRAAAPADVLLPPAAHPLRLALALPAPRTGGSFLGYLPLILAIVGALARPRAAGRWLALALLGWALSLGPALPFYDWIFALPPLQVARYPDRFALLTLLAVALLAAFGADRLLRWTKDERRKTNRGLASFVLRPSSLVAGLLLALMFAELYPGPTPLTTPSDNPFYHALARDPERFSVLELPIARTNSAWLAMYAQTIHGHPILDGALARQVPHVPFRRLTLMAQLERPDTVADISAEPPAARTAALRYFNLRYIIYHRSDGDGPVTPPTAAALARVAGVPVSQVYADDELVAYRLDVPAGPAGLAAVATIGAGWYNLESPGPGAHRWLDPGGGAVQLYAPQDERVMLRLKLAAYKQPRRIDLYLDEQPIGQVEAQTWTAEVRTPPFEMREGPHTLRLAPAGPGISPRSAGEGADDRPLTVTIFELEIESSQ